MSNFGGAPCWIEQPLSIVGTQLWDMSGIENDPGKPWKLDRSENITHV